MEFPTISISEPFTRPTSLFLRNLMSMDVEEMISASPIDGVVLLGGCDKTIPAQLMGAISAGKPALVLIAGPRPVSCFRGNGSFTIDDVWEQCEARRMGELDDEGWAELEGSVNVGVGTCNVMGTATTMAAIAEVLGFALPGSSLPAAASERRRDLARQTGLEIVRAVSRGSSPSELITDSSLENAFRVVTAVGGSTNAVVHLEAIAGRAGLRIGFDGFSAWSETTPLLANVRPTGTFLLDDLDEAGGVPAVMSRIRHLVDLDRPTADGRTWRVVVAERDFPPHPSLATADAPLARRGSLVMLHGNLAPGGAVLKVGASRALVRHHARVVVFNGLDDLNARINDPDLDVDADTILVLRGMGVRGAPGMPEVGHIPIPAKLHREGVRDMLRISDARMSGTSTGSVVLHVSPEAAVGGPLAYLRTGDEVLIDADEGVIRHFLTEEELASREPWQRPELPTRGYAWLHAEHALQPDEGCDFDFLRACGVADRQEQAGAAASDVYGAPAQPDRDT